MITDGLRTAYQSKRLIYRAVENNDNNKHFLYTQIENDPTISALGSSRVIKPGGTKEVEQVISSMLQCPLAVIICLREDVPNDRTGTSKEDDYKTPTPVGFLILGWGSRPGDQMIHRSTNLGISLAAAYQNQGYGGEAINWALDWAFRFGSYHRVSLSTYSYNDRAMHLYKRLGFVEEGRSREAHWYDRKWYDLVNFGMLEKEWEVLRSYENGYD